MSRSDGAWAVTVGTETTGFVLVGTESIRLIQAEMSERELLDAADHKRLAAAFGLLGLSLRTGLTLILSRDE